MELKRERGSSLIFITHDVGLAWALCDRVAVMYLGRVVEQGTTRAGARATRSTRTRSALLSVVPTHSRRAPASARDPRGRAARRVDVPAGCRFHPRCPRARDRCSAEDVAPASERRRRPDAPPAGIPASDALTACEHSDDGPPPLRAAHLARAAELAARDDVVVVIPTATLEDHGHHLPIDTDVRLIEEVARGAVRARQRARRARRSCSRRPCTATRRTTCTSRAR